MRRGGTNKCSEKAETVSQHTTVSTSLTDRHTSKFLKPPTFVCPVILLADLFSVANFFNKSKDLWIIVTKDCQQECVT